MANRLNAAVVNRLNAAAAIRLNAAVVNRLKITVIGIAIFMQFLIPPGASAESVAGGENNEGAPVKAQGLGVAENQAMDAIATQESRSTRPIKDKWAVVIGVDDFKDKTIPRLRFSSKDAKDFARFLVEKANFAPDHVLLLLNENASRHNILSAIGDTWLPRRVFEDDLIVIFASTHGSPKEIDVGGDNFLVAYDTIQDELFTSGIKLQDLAPTIKQRTHCDRVVLILDACNSGAAQAGGKGLFRNVNFDVNALAGRGQIVISSSGADQRSWESKRYENGVFTHNLIEVLKSEQEKSDIDKAFDQLKDKVEQEVKFDRKAFQTPVMHSKWTGEPLKLTARPTSPRILTEDDSPFTYKKIIEMQLKGEVMHPGSGSVPAAEHTGAGIADAGGSQARTTSGANQATSISLHSSSVINDNNTTHQAAGMPGSVPSAPSTSPITPSTPPIAPSTSPITPSTSPIGPSTWPNTPSTPPKAPSTSGKEMDYWMRFQKRR